MDVASMLGLVRRRVEQTEKEGKHAHVVVMTREFATDIDDLWDALTNVERLERWFLPVSGDLEVGGRFQFEGNAGGVVQACEPPERFEITWGMGDEFSWVAVELRGRPGAGVSTLELRHTAHESDFWDRFGLGAVGVGWDGALLGLAAHVGSGEPLDRETFLEWDTSDNGKAFHTAASDAWCNAAIDAGDDPDVARRRAAETGAFYRGESSEPDTDR